MEKSINKNISVGWVLIPPPILSSKEITANEKLLFGKIFGLITNTGSCFASNDWIGNELGLGKETVSNLLSSLVKKEFIFRKIVRDEKGAVIERTLVINYNKINKNSKLDPSPLSNGEVPDTEWGGTRQRMVGLYNIKKKNRKRVSLKIFNSMTYLTNIPIEDIIEFKEKFSATEKQIKEKGEALHDWCLTNGKKKKNYKAFLCVALRKDYPKKDTAENFNNGGFMDYDEAKKKGLIW